MYPFWEEEATYIGGDSSINELSKNATLAIDSVIDSKNMIFLDDQDGLSALVQAYLKSKGYNLVIVVSYGTGTQKNNLGFNITRLVYTNDIKKVWEDMAKEANYGLAIVNDSNSPYLSVFNTFLQGKTTVIINTSSLMTKILAGFTKFTRFSLFQKSN